MRRLRVVSWSILSARLSLSEVSSSTELDAVLTSTPSFLRRSMTSWLGRPKSLASWKTLTFTIRLTPLRRPFRDALAGRLPRLFEGRLGRLWLGGLRGLRGLFRDRAGRLGRLLGQRLLLGQAALFFRLLGRLLRGQALRLRALGLDPRRLFRVLAVPFRLGHSGRLADLLRRLGTHALDLLQLLVRHLQDVGEAGHAGVDQLLGDLVAHPVAFQRAQLLDDPLHARHLRLDLLALLLLALDIDAPAHELGREADVLPLLADGEGELLVLDHDLHDLLLFVDDRDPADLGRRQRLLHEDDRVVVPLDDVDLLAAQLADDRLHAGALHAHAGAHGVHVLLAGDDGHLGPLPRLPDAAPDLDGGVVDLRHLHLEELDEEGGIGAAHHHLRALRRLQDLDDGHPHAVAGLVGLGAALLLAGQEGLGAAEVHHEVPH